jgi:5-methylcytosine-specific restriction endonuclease McrA
VTKRNGSTRAWRRTRERILKTSDICHICGHPGSDAVDHKQAKARGGTDHGSNLAPAHHDVACPTCGHKCNRVKTDKPFAPVVRRSGALQR